MTARRAALPLVAAAIVLAARYDWLHAREFAIKGYASALFFVVLTVPAVYWLAGKWPALVALVALTLPWHPLSPPPSIAYTRMAAPPALTWLPALDAAAPTTLCLGAFVVFAAVAFAVGKRRAWPLVAAFAVILVEAWLHASLRSPYTYTPHFEAPGKWYHLYLDGRAVNADAPLFTVLDGHFAGVPRKFSTLLLRRSYFHFLTSSFTAFLPAFAVYFVANCLAWLGAVAATFAWVRRLGQPARVAAYAAALVACGSGFIEYVAQPMSYLAGFAAVVFILWAYEALADERQFGVVLGLCACVYDLYPLYPLVLIYAWLRGRPVARAALAVAVALAVYGAFLVLEYAILGMPVDNGNAKFAVLHRFDFLALLRAPWIFVRNLAWCFLGAAFVLGAAALVVARERTLLAALYLPAFGLTAYLLAGGARWGRLLLGELPRFDFIAYPAVYLGCALVLARAPRWAAWLVVVALFVVANADVFGLPALYYHFYWPTPMLQDPYR